MAPENFTLRSASPEKMDELPSEEGAKIRGQGRKSSVVFKDPKAKEEKAEESEKERQMIGRADQVYGFDSCVAVKTANPIINAQMEQVRHSPFIPELWLLMGFNVRQKRRFDYFKRQPSKARKYKFTKYVILVRRKISGKGMPTGEEEVDIRGPLLQQALVDIHSDTEDFSFDEEPPQVVHGPPKCGRSLLM